MTKTAIVRRGEAPPQMGVVPRTMEDLDQLARACVGSGFFQDAQQAAQALIKIQAGAELGLPPIRSMTSINVIKGRITLSAGLMAALLKRAGYKIRVRWSDEPLCCSIAVFEGSELIGESSFSTQDARTAGLGGANWQKYPRNMLYARAVSNAARWYAPEVLTGCYLPDELDGAPEDLRPGQPVEVYGRNAPALDRTPSHPTRPTPTPTTDPSEQDAAEADVSVPSAEAAPAADDRDRHMRKLHAIGRECGLDHDGLRDLIGLASLKNASGELLEWACGLLSARTIEELRFAWSRCGEHRQQLSQLKEWSKARMAGGEG